MPDRTPIIAALGALLALAGGGFAYVRLDRPTVTTTLTLYEGIASVVG
jgi:hypothetical protein